jgi:hypothetical protein
VILIKDIVTKDEGFCETPGFDEWLERHSDLIL